MPKKSKKSATPVIVCWMEAGYDGVRPDVHDYCWDLWEWKLMNQVEKAARRVLVSFADISTHTLADVLDELDDCRHKRKKDGT